MKNLQQDNIKYCIMLYPTKEGFCCVFDYFNGKNNIACSSMDIVSKNNEDNKILSRINNILTQRISEYKTSNLNKNK